MAGALYLCRRDSSAPLRRDNAGSDAHDMVSRMGAQPLVAPVVAPLVAEPPVRPNRQTNPSQRRGSRRGGAPDLENHPSQQPLMPVRYHDSAAAQQPDDLARASYAGNSSPLSANVTFWEPLPNPHDDLEAAQSPDDRFSSASMSNISTLTGPPSSATHMPQYDTPAAAIAQARLSSRSPTPITPFGSQPSLNALAQRQALESDLYPQQAYERLSGSSTSRLGVPTAQNRTRQVSPSEVGSEAPPSYTTE